MANAPYQAMARRYRPATFDEVIGQEHVARTLANAIAAGRVAHAYLFCGPHGCGKTSMARIFARALVCATGPTATPCGTCPFCLDVARGVDVDVQEIDGASNNGVEQVRTLREQAAYVPQRARCKIYIIDEVHMLSTPAFNALLKTLEEPPAHVKFILATTDPHKLPETVLSRCQRFDFRLVPPPRLAAFFKELARRESAAIEDDALEAVAAFAGGSVRDGLVLLDQLLSYAQGAVRREDVERVRGVAPAEAVAGLVGAIRRRDLAGALAVVDEVAARGTASGDFLDQLIEFCRDLMVLVGTGRAESVTSYGPARAALAELSRSVPLDQAVLMLDVFVQARTRVRQRALSNPLVPLEMAVARLAGLDDLQPVGTLLARLEGAARNAPASAVRAAPPAAPPPVAPAREAAKPRPFEPAAPAAPASATPAPAAPPVAAPAPAPMPVVEAPAVSASAGPSGPPLDAAFVRSVWPRILETLQSVAPQDLKYLRSVSAEAQDAETLAVIVPGGSSFLFEQIEDPSRKTRLANAAAKVIGRPVSIRLRLGPSPAGAEAETSTAAARERIQVQARGHREARNDPAVQLLVLRFDGQVLNIEEDGSRPAEERTEPVEESFSPLSEPVEEED